MQIIKEKESKDVSVSVYAPAVRVNQRRRELKW